MPLLAGLIGDPVAHSISPIFQQAAFDALGIDARYEAWRTPLDALVERVASLRGPGFLGANVTVPHKQAVMPLLDHLSEAAVRVGAVNTIVRTGSGLGGDNTDIEGFTRALREDGGFDPQGMRAAVLGAGGAARAVVYALIQAGAASVLVLNRTPERAAEVVAAVAAGRGEAGRLEDADGDGAAERMRSRLAGHDLIVNCTTVGMRHAPGEGRLPVPDPALPDGAFIADIVANPLETPLLRAAAARGLHCLGGLPMLVRQGAASFERWTGRPAPLDAMFAAASAAMEPRP